MDNVEKAGDLTCKRFFLLNHVEKVWIDFGKITYILVHTSKNLHHNKENVGILISIKFSRTCTYVSSKFKVMEELKW